MSLHEAIRAPSSRRFLFSSSGGVYATSDVPTFRDGDVPGFSGLIRLCGQPTPTGPTEAVGPAAANTSAECYAVKFEATWLSDNGMNVTTFALTGDLVGTMTTTFDLSQIKYSGPQPMFSGGTMSIPGTAVWTITGGVVPDVTTFETTFTNRNQLSAVAGSAQPDVTENIGQHRATSGVSKANLSYKGTASLAGGSVYHTYWGVLCP